MKCTSLLFTIIIINTPLPEFCPSTLIKIAECSSPLYHSLADYVCFYNKSTIIFRIMLSVFFRVFFVFLGLT